MIDNCDEAEQFIKQQIHIQNTTGTHDIYGYVRKEYFSCGVSHLEVIELMSGGVELLAAG